jgi:GTPase involved in cell partitioning and DNA repair
LQFIDEARFVVRAGRGGDGSVSFNREKYKPRGGPDGGRGGDGGSVIFRATLDLQTLEPYAYRKLVKAERGRHGSGNNRSGEKGADVVLDVPRAPSSTTKTACSPTSPNRGRSSSLLVAVRGGVATLLLRPRPGVLRPSGRRGSPARRGRSASSSGYSPTWGSSGCPTPASPRCSRV